jgi:hypothetical protein
MGVNFQARPLVCVCVPDMKSQQGDRTPTARETLLLLLLQAGRKAGPLRGGQKRMDTLCVCACAVSLYDMRKIYKISSTLIHIACRQNHRIRLAVVVLRQ